MDEIKMWAIDGTEATPVSAKNMTDSEWQLEEILVNNPDLLMPELTLVGRQTDTEGGPLDLLGVDSDGRLVLFELKRGRLSRDAVAQIIDYASDLEAMGVDRLAAYIAERSGAGGIKKIDEFEQWHTENSGADSLDALLPLRMFLVGLGADDRTERMVDFLANKGVDISLLTFHGFEQDGNMMLTRLTQVVADAESVSGQSQSRKRVSRAERQEQLNKRAEENNTRPLFDDVSDMFRKEFSQPSEDPNSRGLTMYKSMRWDGNHSRMAFARVDPDPRPGQVRIVFYDRSVELCPDEFRPLLDEIEYETWSWTEHLVDRQGTPLLTPYPPQIHFLVSAEEWETHKGKLSALTQAVYAAARQRADG